MDLIILLLNWNDIGKQGLLLDGLDGTNIQKFLTLLFNLYIELQFEVPWGLLDRDCSFFNINLCVTNCGSSPGISIYVHVKMSLNTCNKLRSGYLSSEERLALKKRAEPLFLLLRGWIPSTPHLVLLMVLQLNTLGMIICIISSSSAKLKIMGRRLQMTP